MAGNFILNWTDDGMKGAIVINDMTVDTSATTLTLFGRGVVDYGEKLQENLLRLTENFCSGTPPNNPTRGQLWYDASATRMRLWTGGAWVTAMADLAIAEDHAGDMSKHLTLSQNTLLDSISVSATQINYLVGATSNIQDQITSEFVSRTANDSAIITNLNNHATNMTLHLTPAQNTWLDTITATATQINYLGGLTANAQTQINDRLPLAGGTLTGALTLSSNPTLPMHATTKQYVDDLVSGLDPKESVVCATTANLSATLSANVLTATENGLLTLDSITPSVNSRVLVKDQNTALQNGVYRVTDLGSSTTKWVLTRASDFVAGAISSGAYLFIEGGLTQQDSAWVLATDGSISINSTGLNFVQFNGGGQVTVGAGLVKNGSVIDLSNTGVAPGAYNNVTVGLDGRVSSATSIGYLTQNQSITISGDVIGSGSTSIAVALSNTGVAAGSYSKVTVDSKGRVTAGGSLAASDVPPLDWSKITTSKPTTLIGYGITDGIQLSSTVPSAPASGSVGIATTAARADHVHPLQTAITGNASTASTLQTARSITASGDVAWTLSFDGSTNVTSVATLASTGVASGTYTKVAVDTKGRVVGGYTLTAADVPNLDWTKITTGKPTTLDGFNITDAYTKSEIDSAIASAVSGDADVYTKTEVDSIVDVFYTKAEVDALITAAIATAVEQALDQTYA